MKNKKLENQEQAKKAAISWTEHAWDDYMTWQKEKPEVVDKINDLINGCFRDPFKGIGKPEPLGGNLTGFWSRRISHEHRLVYMFENGTLYIVQCRLHY
jgi:toxin YoeB